MIKNYVKVYNNKLIIYNDLLKKNYSLINDKLAFYLELLKSDNTILETDNLLNVKEQILLKYYDNIYLPYGNYNMINENNIKFNKRFVIKEFLNNKKNIEMLYKKYDINFATFPDMPSLRDLNKMYDYENNILHDYIYTKNLNLQSWIPNINTASKIYFSYDNIPNLFLPYSENLYKPEDINIDELTFNKNLQLYIINESQFVSYIDNLINTNILTKEDKGYIFYEFINQFKISKLYYELEDSNIIPYMPTYGLDKKQVSELLDIRFKKLHDYEHIFKKINDNNNNNNNTNNNNKTNDNDNTNNNINNNSINNNKNDDFINYLDNKYNYLDNICDKIKKKIINYLSEKNNLSLHDDNYNNMNKIYELCFYKKLNLHLLYDDEYFKLENVEQKINYCSNKMIMSPNNSIKCQVRYNCDNMINLIQDTQVKATLMNYINNTKDDNKILCDYKQLHYIYNEPMDNTFMLCEKLMPEWFINMKKGSVEQAFKYRQLVLGLVYKYPNYLDYSASCSLIFGSKPFVQAGIMGLEWNPYINKYVVACLANKDVIFPLRIVGNININIYSYFTKNLDDNIIFLGSIFSNYKKFERKNHKFLFYNKNNKKLMNINFKSMFADHPFVSSENFRILYAEFTLLYYFEKDFGKKLYYYKFIKQPTTDENCTVFVSQYDINMIKLKYLELGFNENEVNIILNDIKQVELKKNDNGLFYYDEY